MYRHSLSLIWVEEWNGISDKKKKWKKKNRRKKTEHMLLLIEYAFVDVDIAFFSCGCQLVFCSPFVGPSARISPRDG